jgi:predicted Zn-dependent protease
VPNHSFARRTLIRTYIRGGQPAKALAALKPVLGMAERDPALLALAGEVYLLNGQPAEAAKYFTKTLALDPKNSGGRLGVAVSHLATGQTDIAFQELERTAAESSGAQADLIRTRRSPAP